MVAGLEQPDQRARSASAAGTSPRPRADQRPVNTVFQSYALFPHLDVLDNVAFGLRRRSVPRRRRRRSTAALDLVELGAPRPTASPAQLSGGQQQRVALARALVNQPGRAAAGRAARRPGHQAAPADAGRAQADPDRGRPDLRARHPRPGGGHDHGRHRRRDERRPDRADGRRRRELYELPRTAFVANFLGQSNLVAGDGRRRTAATPSSSMPPAAGWPCPRTAPAVTRPARSLVGIRPEKLRLTAARQDAAGRCGQRAAPARSRIPRFTGVSTRVPGARCPGSASSAFSPRTTAGSWPSPGDGVRAQLGPGARLRPAPKTRSDASGRR